MGLDFLQNNGARRMRDYPPQPPLPPGDTNEDSQPEEDVNLDLEQQAADWRPHDVAAQHPAADWPYCPARFVDGKDVGRTVAWLQSREGYPVPVRLAEIGAVVMRNKDGVLRREFSVVERVVTLMADLFDWDQVESFAIALQEHGFRFLPCPAPESNYSYDFERMRKTTQNRSNDEMSRLEREALASQLDQATLVDGRLEPRAGAFDPLRDPVIGLVKSHWRNYLHPQGWRVFYDLTPDQRTPAFTIKARNLDVVSWYVRLEGARGELPNWGIVRIEVAAPFFKQTLGMDWTFVDAISRIACDYRCRDDTYGRAPVSLAPIQRAEESLGALFTQADHLIARFYHLTNL